MSGVSRAELRLLDGLAHPLARPLIGIDGLPCAGKTTLAFRLAEEHGFEIMQVDEFLRPEADWLSRRPGFPFPYLRYDEFLQAVTDLAETGECTYAPFDWDISAVSVKKRRITTARPVIVEGISALVPLLERYYGLKIFVKSDRGSILEVARARSLGLWAREWREIFLPSADMYMLTHPEKRADLVVQGRGMKTENDQRSFDLAAS